MSGTGKCLEHRVATVTPTTTNSVNLKSNRYTQSMNEGTSSALAEEAGWMDKLQYAAACYQTVNFFPDAISGTVFRLSLPIQQQQQQLVTLPSLHPGVPRRFSSL
ncbi:unnamed protein product [Gongylonema pulchrum]|uniref:Uncharacterized protein n=1 Tax=Gongylonema pulchrum TaxID=637853 RepID=A0A183D3B0_9BILA|nr:unnamed protein product [Gongylonema pulchrum]